MLLFAVPLIWLAVATFVVLLCRAAADGDAALLMSAKRASAGTTTDGIGSSSGRIRTTWRRTGMRSAVHAGNGTRRRMGRESDLLARRGSE
jgi:hypothetical protein